QGYSRELLFWLFTQSVEAVIPGHGAVLYRYQPPDDYGCPRNDPRKRCFQEFVLIAIYTGLTVEQRTATRPSSRTGGANDSPKKAETTSFFRFCFDPLLAANDREMMGEEGRRKALQYLDFPLDERQLSPRCGAPWDPRKTQNFPQKDSFELKVGPMRFRI